MPPPPAEELKRISEVLSFKSNRTNLLDGDYYYDEEGDDFEEEFRRRRRNGTPKNIAFPRDQIVTKKKLEEVNKSGLIIKIYIALHELGAFFSPEIKIEGGREPPLLLLLQQLQGPGTR